MRAYNKVLNLNHLYIYLNELILYKNKKHVIINVNILLQQQYIQHFHKQVFLLLITSTHLNKCYTLINLTC